MNKFQCILAAAGLLFAAAGHADIYKWIDAQGNVHYSDNKDAAGKAKVSELKVAPPPPVPQPAPAAAPQGLSMTGATPPKPNTGSFQAPRARPAPAWGGDQVETDKSRCALARDVLSGAARHQNGVRTDANDREVAERDVKSFCH